MENSETIDEEKLAEVAKALGVTAEAIKNFSEENMTTYFNTFTDNDFSNNGGAVGELVTITTVHLTH